MSLTAFIALGKAWRTPSEGTSPLVSCLNLSGGNCRGSRMPTKAKSSPQSAQHARRLEQVCLTQHSTLSAGLVLKLGRSSGRRAGPHVAGPHPVARGGCPAAVQAERVCALCQPEQPATGGGCQVSSLSFRSSQPQSWRLVGAAQGACKILVAWGTLLCRWGCSEPYDTGEKARPGHLAQLSKAYAGVDRTKVTLLRLARQCSDPFQLIGTLSGMACCSVFAGAAAELLEHGRSRGEVPTQALMLKCAFHECLWGHSSSWCHLMCTAHLAGVGQQPPPCIVLLGSAVVCAV